MAVDAETGAHRSRDEAEALAPNVIEPCLFRPIARNMKRRLSKRKRITTNQ